MNRLDLLFKCGLDDIVRANKRQKLPLFQVFVLCWIMERLLFFRHNFPLRNVILMLDFDLHLTQFVRPPLPWENLLPEALRDSMKYSKEQNHLFGDRRGGKTSRANNPHHHMRLFVVASRNACVCLNIKTRLADDEPAAAKKKHIRVER